MAPKKKKTRPTPKRYHFYAVFLFILGTLFPPLAVAARFGIGKDFWINLLLTICGYIPGHGHNFYIQNIRNNKTHRRTPKWAQRYGLVNTSKIKRDEKKSQWATRYNDRLPESALEGQAYEEGQESVDMSLDGEGGDQPKQKKQSNGDGLWNPDEESYYSQGQDGNQSQSSGRWHYPANFEDTTLSPIESPKKSKKKKDRWARTEDAYSQPEERRKKKSKKVKKKSSVPGGASIQSGDSTPEFPEDPAGGLYGERGGGGGGDVGQRDGGEQQHKAQTGDDVFHHEF